MSAPSINLDAIAQRYGGRVRGESVLIRQPGHSKCDRSAKITRSRRSPDGVVVCSYSDGVRGALAVKDMLRRDGFLPTYGKPVRELTEAENAELDRDIAEAEERRQRLYSQAAEQARQIWASARPAEWSHRYMVSHGHLSPVGIRQLGSNLVIPMVDRAGALWNLQTIRPDGFKLYMTDARTEGLFWQRGLGSDTTDPIIIGEGWASTAACHAATRYPAVAAMTLAKLLPIARTIRELFPSRLIVVAADFDGHLIENAGVRAATQAARAVKGAVALPIPIVTDAAHAGRKIDFADIPRANAAAFIERALQQRGEIRP